MSILRNKNIVLGVCGSISAYKSPYIVRLLRSLGANVRVVMTESASQFVAPTVLENLSLHPVIQKIFDDRVQALGSWHVSWSRWADAMLIAPTSASTLQKLAWGSYDSAISLVAASLDPIRPLVVAPAMDLEMWQQESVTRNVYTLETAGVHVMKPEYGELASGLHGQGRLPEPDAIVEYLCAVLEEMSLGAASKVPDLRGQTVVVCAGPTKERIDAVRYISNDSSGKMGYAIARVIRDAGARVILVSGPTSLRIPDGLTYVGVESASDMFEAMKRETANANAIVMSAAVADYSPTRAVGEKLKKEVLGEYPVLELKQTTDILRWLGANKRAEQILIGFALETTNPIQNATRKLKEKNADFVVVNEAGKPDSGFAGDNNTVTVISRSGDHVDFPSMSKYTCARRIVAHCFGAITSQGKGAESAVTTQVHSD